MVSTKEMRIFYQITLQFHIGDTQHTVQHRDFTVVDSRTSVTAPYLHQRTLILEFRRVISSCLGRWYGGKCTRQWIQYVSRRLCKLVATLEWCWDILLEFKRNTHKTGIGHDSLLHLFHHISYWLGALSQQD